MSAAGRIVRCRFHCNHTLTHPMNQPCGELFISATKGDQLLVGCGSVISVRGVVPRVIESVPAAPVLPPSVDRCQLRSFVLLTGRSLVRLTCGDYGRISKSSCHSQGLSSFNYTNGSSKKRLQSLRSVARGTPQLAGLDMCGLFRTIDPICPCSNQIYPSFHHWIEVYGRVGARVEKGGGLKRVDKDRCGHNSHRPDDIMCGCEGVCTGKECLTLAVLEHLPIPRVRMTDSVRSTVHVCTLWWYSHEYLVLRYRVTVADIGPSWDSVKHKIQTVGGGGDSPQYYLCYNDLTTPSRCIYTSLLGAAVGLHSLVDIVKAARDIGKSWLETEAEKKARQKKSGKPSSISVLDFPITGNPVHAPTDLVYINPMASLALTDSSQLTAKNFEKLPDQIIYPYAEPYGLQKHVFSICHSAPKKPWGYCSPCEPYSLQRLLMSTRSNDQSTCVCEQVLFTGHESPSRIPTLHGRYYTTMLDAPWLSGQGGHAVQLFSEVDSNPGPSPPPRQSSSRLVLIVKRRVGEVVLISLQLASPSLQDEQIAILHSREEFTSESEMAKECVGIVATSYCQRELVGAVSRLVSAERDGLSAARHELERKLEFRDLELHEKEEELFLQLEKVVRLEEDCEKLRAEKEKFGQWKDKLEREKNEAYRQLKRQSSESEATRRGLERARQEVVRQVTVIAAERDSLEKENEHLKETLSEERRGVGHYLVDLTKQKKRISQNMVGLEKEVTELKYINCQSTSLNNQFKKGMKHLATCRRKKCSVCTYTKDTFGEYRNDKKLLSCFQAPLQDLRKWIRPMPNPSDKYSTSCPDNEEGGERLSSASGCSVYLAHSSPFPSTRSEYSFRHNYSSDTQTSTSSPSPSPSFPLNSLIPIPFISYIDDESTSSESSSDSGHGEDLDGPPCHCPYGAPSVPTDTSLTSSSSAPVASSSRAFSSDSGFSSELYESGRKSRGGAKTPLEGEDERSHAGLQRSKWTSSFRRLINKVSKR
uniref:Uncharacterized protein n=1 Tax=Timema douglasi TaxID=61478 RepID=A0A7R8VIC9_TIMDO|nr:unnamed protein product [Timema douglasi]